MTKRAPVAEAPLIDLSMSVADLFVHVQTTIQQRHETGALVGSMEQGREADLLFLVRDSLERIVIAVAGATEQTCVAMMATQVKPED